MRWALLGLVLIAGCVEQTPGLAVSVEVAPVARAVVETPLGALAVDEAWLTVAAVELVPCEQSARWWWPVGVAHAHGEAGEAGLRVAVDTVIAPLAGPRALAEVALPPDTPICGVRLDLGESPAVRLVGRLDGERREWLAAPAAGRPLPIPALTLDAGRRAAAIAVRVDLADWVVGLPAGEGASGTAAQAAVIAANAVAGLTAVVEPR